MHTQQELPNATLILVLGALSIFTCMCYGIIGIILGTIALILANNAIQLYQANPEQYKGYENIKAGKICALIGISLSSLLLFMMIIHLIHGLLI